MVFLDRLKDWFYGSCLPWGKRLLVLLFPPSNQIRMKRGNGMVEFEGKFGSMGDDPSNFVARVMAGFNNLVARSPSHFDSKFASTQLEALCRDCRKEIDNMVAERQNVICQSNPLTPQGLQAITQAEAEIEVIGQVLNIIARYHNNLMRLEAQKNE